MSPKNKIKLNFLRKKLDNIDIRLLKIVKERTEIIKKVLSLKAYKNEIIDKKRISAILKKIKKESFKRNIDPKITHRIWKNMIWSYINFEKKNFKKKYLFTMRGKFFFYKNFMLSCRGIIFFCF